MLDSIALIDCNNFYASCERVFQPALRARPIVVLSNNDGCIIARSEEAKQIGITMGAPFFKVQTLLEFFRVKVFSSNYALYGDMSQRVAEALHEFTPEVEVYSIDEAFAVMREETDAELLKKATEIRQKIKKWTGIPVSIGIAPTKTLAKLANRLAKKQADGVFCLNDKNLQNDILSRADVEDIWGIGRNSAKRLREFGIRTALDLREADRRTVRGLCSITGARIGEELRGVRCLEFENEPPPKKSLTCSRSFGDDVCGREILREAVNDYLVKAGEKMRRHNLTASAITVFIATNRFAKNETYYANGATFSLANATDSTTELRGYAMRGLDKIYRSGLKYKKAGIILQGLTPKQGLTTRLFDENELQRDERLFAAIDKINRRFGRKTIHFGAEHGANLWQMKAEMKSRAYTTNLREVLGVK